MTQQVQWGPMSAGSCAWCSPSSPVSAMYLGQQWIGGSVSESLLTMRGTQMRFWVPGCGLGQSWLCPGSPGRGLGQPWPWSWAALPVD